MENVEDLMRVCSDKVAKLLTERRQHARLSQMLIARRLRISRSAIAKRESEGIRDIGEILKHLGMIENDPHLFLIELINQIAKK